MPRTNSSVPLLTSSRRTKQSTNTLLLVIIQCRPHLQHDLAERDKTIFGCWCHWTKVPARWAHFPTKRQVGQLTTCLPLLKTKQRKENDKENFLPRIDEFSVLLGKRALINTAGCVDFRLGHFNTEVWRLTLRLISLWNKRYSRRTPNCAAIQVAELFLSSFCF